MNSFMRSVFVTVLVCFGLGLVLLSTPAEATDKGCEAACNAECKSLPRSERNECRQECFAECDNRGAQKKYDRWKDGEEYCDRDDDDNYYRWNSEERKQRKECRQSCKTDCNDLPEEAQKECKLQCLAGRCGSRWVMKEARGWEVTGILCEGDEACNEFCAEGTVSDPDCAASTPDPEQGGGPYVLASIPASVQAFVPFTVTITILDPNGNPDPTYQGTVEFATTDVFPGVSVPPAFTFTEADHGAHVFGNGFILVTPGMQDIYVTELDGQGRQVVVSINVAPLWQ